MDQRKFSLFVLGLVLLLIGVNLAIYFLLKVAFVIAVVVSILLLALFLGFRAKSSA